MKMLKFREKIFTEIKIDTVGYFGNNALVLTVA